MKCETDCNDEILVDTVPALDLVRVLVEHTSEDIHDEYNQVSVHLSPLRAVKLARKILKAAGQVGKA